MSAATPKPPTPPHRWIGLLLSRKFWIAVAAVVVVVLVAYSLVEVPVGPFSFSFSWSASACGCQHTVSTNHTFPDRAFVSMSFTSHYLGSPAEYILLVANPNGKLIVYAVMEWGSLGTVNYANVSETFTTTVGGSYEFTIQGTEPLILPGVSAWVNGTYTAPTLS